MMSKFFIVVALTLLTTRTPADETKPPQIGEQAAGWKNLVGTDDQQHSLADLHDKDVIVVCFTCNSCPYAVDYEERLVALQTRFANDAKVQVVAINSNTVPADRLEQMKGRAESRKFNFPYLWDETQEVAKAWGAIYTPEFYVLNRRREIVYRGAMDDSTKAENVKVRYVELAITAAMQGQSPAVTKTGARGCAIRFQRRRR